jgi:hypothetical protein
MRQDQDHYAELKKAKRSRLPRGHSAERTLIKCLTSAPYYMHGEGMLDAPIRPKLATLKTQPSK